MDDGLALTVLPGAVSPLVAGELAGAPRRCRVLAVFPTCLYLDAGAHERVLAVLASDAVALPIGIRLTIPSAELRWGLEPGDRVVVGEGRVRLPRADVVGARLLRPMRVRSVSRQIHAAAGLAEPGVLGDLTHDLTAAALAGRSADPGVRGLVGVGRGLTPSGDDALCGVLLTLAAIDTPSCRVALSAVRTAVRSVLPWTTSLSAALLVAAGTGYAVPDVARLVTLLAGGGTSGRDGGPAPDAHQGSEASDRSMHLSREPSGLTERTDLTEPSDLTEITDLVGRVLAIGHTSGRDLLAGVSGALRAVDAHQSAAQEGAHRG